jgi:hypothetical protein
VRVLLAAALLAACVSAAGAQESASRTLVGQVTNNSDQPVADAVVYLKNTKDVSVKSYITDKDGRYRFSALSPTTDYEVHAEHQGRRSDTKTLSSFDNRKQATINLRLK